jgi:hypothetical protein
LRPARVLAVRQLDGGCPHVLRLKFLP